MIRRNRRPDWRRVKRLRSYTIEEAATALSVHRNAVRYWIKHCGLPVSKDQRPHLIHGAELADFLKQRREAKRRKCGPGEFYCLKCREPRRSAAGMIDYRTITPKRGVLIGICPTCETLLRRFVSKAQLETTGREFGLNEPRREDSLEDTSLPSLGCHSDHED